MFEELQRAGFASRRPFGASTPRCVAFGPARVLIPPGVGKAQEGGLGVDEAEDGCLKNGEGGIRTRGTSLTPYNGLANRRFQPLSHLSGLTNDLTIRR